MKARALKKRLNTGYVVHDGGDRICLASALCHDLLSVSKDGLKIKYALDTFQEGKKSARSQEILSAWDGLEQLIASGEIKEFIEGQDDLEKHLPVFSYEGKDFQIVESLTDEYGWPNTDINGRLMYDNLWFATKKEAIDRAINECKLGIKWRKEALQEKQQEIARLQQRSVVELAALERLERELEAL